MKKKFLVICLSIIAAIVLALAVYFISGNNITVARCIIRENGTIYMDYHERPVLLNYGEETDWQTGDKLLILHQTAFAESYPEQTRAYFILRIGKGSTEDVSENARNILDELDIGP